MDLSAKDNSKKSKKGQVKVTIPQPVRGAKPQSAVVFPATFTPPVQPVITPVIINVPQSSPEGITVEDETKEAEQESPNTEQLITPLAKTLTHQLSTCRPYLQVNS